MPIHLFRTYNLPVLLSGLQALPIRPATFKPQTLFHNNTLSGFLKLSQSSPTPALHFLLGEFPIEAQLHISTLTLFHNVWSTINKLVWQILMMSDNWSTTWANHIKQLCQKYDLPNPLSLMDSSCWTKPNWKCLVVTKVTVYHDILVIRHCFHIQQTKCAKCGVIYITQSKQYNIGE